MRALPPEVVSGLPYMTPILFRSWLMKMMVVPLLLAFMDSLRRAWLIMRAWTPICATVQHRMEAVSRRTAAGSPGGWVTGDLRA